MTTDSSNTNIYSYQRARTVALVVLGMLAAMIPVVLIDFISFGSFVNFIFVIVAIIAHLAYYYLIRPAVVKPYAVAITIFDVFLIAAVVFNTGGFISFNVVLYVFVILCISFVLGESFWTLFLTVIAIITNTIVAFLQINDILIMNEKMQKIFDATTNSYRYFALGAQTVMLLGVGAFMVVFTRLVQQRERDLEQAHLQSQTYGSEQAVLLQRLETSNDQLQITETALRQTVDALTVAALPIADGVLVLPLIGGFDQERARSVRERLLKTIHEQRANAVILDLTGIDQASPILLTMIEQLVSGVRLLGAQIILAGTQPDVARSLVKLQFASSGVVSAPTLAEALRRIQPVVA